MSCDRHNETHSEPERRAKPFQFRLWDLLVLITVCAVFLRQPPHIAAITLMYAVGLWIVVRDIVSYQLEKHRNPKRRRARIRDLPRSRFGLRTIWA